MGLLGVPLRLGKTVHASMLLGVLQIQLSEEKMEVKQGDPSLLQQANDELGTLSKWYSSDPRRVDFVDNVTVAGVACNIPPHIDRISRR